MDSKKFVFTAQKDGFKTYDEAMEWGLSTGNAYSKDQGLIPYKLKIEFDRYQDEEQEDDFTVLVEVVCLTE